MTQALDKPRPKKAKVETYQVDGRTVTLTQVPADLERPVWANEESKAMRGKWEVRLDGVHVGYAFYPKGVGNPWVLTSLVPKSCGDFYSYGETFYVRAWEPPGPDNSIADDPQFYRDYGGLLQSLKKIVPWRGDLKEDTAEQWFEYDADWNWTGREQIAQWIPRFAANGRLPDQAGVLTLIEADKVERERRRLAKIAEEAADAAKRVRWQAEAAQQKREAEQLRKETLEGLQSIQNRTDLSNFEAAALAEAIKKFSA